MSHFPETIRAHLQGVKVQCAPLVLFDFTSSPMRLWKGHGTLTTNDGHEWLSIGTLGSMEGIGQAVNGTAPEMKFMLSGVDAEIMRLANEEFESEVRHRLVRVLIQFFGVPDEADPENQRCYDRPFPVAAGRCMKPMFDILEDGTRSVTVSAETLFSARGRPAAAMYTDRDQQARFPGDKGFEFAPHVVRKTVTWPDY